MATRDLGPRPFGIELEVALPVRPCLLTAPGLLERHREIEVRVGESGIELDRGGEKARSLDHVSALIRQEAEIVVRLGLPFVDGERLGVKPLGFFDITTAEAQIA